MKTLWRTVEPFVWAFATLSLLYVVYAVIVYRPKGFFWDWPFWGQLVVIVLVSFWWTGFKSRLAKFLRESLRGMIAEEMNKAITLTISPVLPDTTG